MGAGVTRDARMGSPAHGVFARRDAVRAGSGRRGWNAGRASRSTPAPNRTPPVADTPPPPTSSGPTPSGPAPSGAPAPGSPTQGPPTQGPPIRALSRASSKAFVIACIVLMVIASVGGAYYLTRVAKQPDNKARIQQTGPGNENAVPGFGVTDGEK